MRYGSNLIEEDDVPHILGISTHSSLTMSTAMSFSWSEAQRGQGYPTQPTQLCFSWLNLTNRENSSSLFDTTVPLFFMLDFCSAFPTVYPPNDQQRKQAIRVYPPVSGRAKHAFCFAHISSAAAALHQVNDKTHLKLKNKWVGCRL